MIKVRLHGKLDEMEQFIEIAEQLEKFNMISILSTSDTYKDRGKSQYSRIYLDVEVNPEFMPISKNKSIKESAINIGNTLRLNLPDQKLK